MTVSDINTEPANKPAKPDSCGTYCVRNTAREWLRYFGHIACHAVSAKWDTSGPRTGALLSEHSVARGISGLDIALRFALWLGRSTKATAAT